MVLKKKKNNILLFNKKLLKIHSNKIKAYINIILYEHSKYNKNINIIFINKQEIKDLNFKYRNKNKITDVISFSMEEGENKEFSGNMLGDIYICEEYIGNDNREIFTRIIHGVLHLLGYDHIKNKKEYSNFIKLQEFYVEDFFNKYVS